MLDSIGFVHFFLQLGDRGVFLLRLQKVPQVVDLSFETVVDQVIKMMPEDDPHAGAEDELSEREDSQVPEGEPHADGELLHTSPAGRITYPTPRTV